MLPDYAKISNQRNSSNFFRFAKDLLALSRLKGEHTYLDYTMIQSAGQQISIRGLEKSKSTFRSTFSELNRLYIDHLSSLKLSSIADKLFDPQSESSRYLSGMFKDINRKGPEKKEKFSYQQYRSTHYHRHSTSYFVQYIRTYVYKEGS